MGKEVAKIAKGDSGDLKSCNKRNSENALFESYLGVKASTCVANHRYFSYFMHPILPLNSEESIQSAFLERVRKMLPPNLSFVDDLAEILAISRDSAYRRIRGETVLSLDEVKKICAHYNVSMDVLLSPHDQVISFHHRRIDHDHFTFEHWIRSILANLEMISSFPEKELFYGAKDIPIFHYFKFPTLGAFKMFFWMRTYLRYPELANQKFSLESISRDLLEVGRRTWDRYSEIPSTEIWSEETSHVTLRQIKYYYESGIVTREQAIVLYDEFSRMIDDVQVAASEGSKGKGKFSLFVNEVMIAETSILFKMGDKRVAYLAYNTMDLLTTSLESFCIHIEEFFNNAISVSVQISTTGERDRSKFFNQIHDNIEDTKKKLV